MTNDEWHWADVETIIASYERMKGERNAILAAFRAVLGMSDDATVPQMCREIETMYDELAALRERVPERCGVPTKPGWYWWRQSEDDDWQPAEVWPDEAGDGEWFLVLSVNGLPVGRLDDISGQWATLPEPQ